MPRGKSPRYKELRPGHLRAFREVVQRKSFSAAARALDIAQPTLWEQVRALERMCGAVLLERHGREWTPTEDGLLALELAGSIVDSLESFQETFQANQETLPRQLIFSAVPGAITEDLAEPIVAFCRAYPRIHLQLPSYVGISITDLVLTGEADLGCLVQPQGTPANSHSLLCKEAISRRPAALFVPCSHPLATQTTLTLSDLVQYPLILPGIESDWRRCIDEVFRAAGLLPQRQILMEVTPTNAARRYASMGLGMALFPLPAGHLPYSRVVIHPLDDLFPAEEVILIWRRASRLRPQAQLFIDFIHKHLSPQT